jgi:hypothetical protein
MLSYASNDLTWLASTAEFCLVRVEPTSLVAEYIFLYYAKLLYFHTATRTSYRPDDLRKVLERALKHFPTNSIFLHLYLLNVSPSL